MFLQVMFAPGQKADGYKILDSHLLPPILFGWCSIILNIQDCQEKLWAQFAFFPFLGKSDILEWVSS